MGKFDKYKKTQEKTNLDKYKKKSGSSFDEIEKTLEQTNTQPKTQTATQEKGSAGGTILIIVLGIITILVWFLAINKLMG